MKFNAVIERDPGSDVLVASIPGISGAHTQGASVDEVLERLSEVVQLLAEEGEIDEASALRYIPTTTPLGVVVELTSSKVFGMARSGKQRLP